MKSAGIAVLLLITGLGVYAGTAGFLAGKNRQEWRQVAKAGGTSGGSVEYRSLDFQDEDCLRVFIRQQRYARWCAWVFTMPSELTPLVLAAGFGLLGGTIGTWRALASGSCTISTISSLSRSCFGLLMGMAVFLASFVLPALFLSGQTENRPETGAGMALLGGMFAEQVFGWLRNSVEAKLQKGH
jgi:hypothetical protein